MDRTVEVDWEKSQSQVVHSSDDLRNLLVRLHAEASRQEPMIAEVTMAVGSIAIGLGLPETVLSFTRADKEPPYLATCGDQKRDDIISFLYGGQDAEFPGSHAVPFEEGLEAVIAFASIGRLPRTIEWQDV